METKWSLATQSDMTGLKQQEAVRQWNHPLRGIADGLTSVCRHPECYGERLNVPAI